jgi:tetratricopeptide (TPR) repeat protein
MKKLFFIYNLLIISFLAQAQGVADYKKHYDLGRELAQKGQFQTAIAEFDRAIQKMPYYSMLYFERGMAKMQLKNYESAIVDFNQAIQKKPYDMQIYLQRGIALTELKNYSAATSDLEKVLADNPNDALAGTYYKQAQQALQLADNETPIVSTTPFPQDNRGLRKQYRRQIRNQILWRTVVPIAATIAFWLLIR